MSAESFDLFVIGGGSGGVRAAREAARHGARVAIAEVDRLGGTCVNLGCIPKKLFVYAASFGRACRDARGYGWDVAPPRHDWRRLLENKDRELARLNAVYARLLDESGVTRIEGRANFVDATTLDVAGRRFEARYVLIATGGRPSRPSFSGAEHAVTSNEMFSLAELPARVVIEGGGYIASEFACILAGLGCRVTQLYRGPLFLRGFDVDVRTTLAAEMRKHGIDLLFDCGITEVRKNGSSTLEIHTSRQTLLEADLLLSAIGRVPNTEGLSLERAGVRTSPKTGAIVVDECSQTSVENIYAVGDVTARVQLTPVALAEGAAVAATLFGGAPIAPDHSLIPSAVFTEPAVGTVGLTEEQARELYGDVHVYRARFRPLKHTLTGSDEETMVKLVVHPDTDRVLGCHMVGHDAPEIIGGLAIALRAGATKAQFDATLGVHPTAAEEFVTLRRMSTT